MSRPRKRRLINRFYEKERDEENVISYNTKVLRRFHEERRGEPSSAESQCCEPHSLPEKNAISSSECSTSAFLDIRWGVKSTNEVSFTFAFLCPHEVRSCLGGLPFNFSKVFGARKFPLCSQIIDTGESSLVDPYESDGSMNANESMRGNRSEISCSLVRCGNDLVSGDHFICMLQ